MTKAKGSPSIKTLFQKGPGKTKASHQSKVEMEANKKKKAKKENIWTAHANSDVSDSQLNDSDETQIVFEQFNIHFKSVRLVYIYT